MRSRRVCLTRTPGSRGADRRWPSTELDVLVIGGGVVGAGCALDAATRGLSRRPRRGPGLRLRHVQPLQQAHPRRPALPGDARLPAGREALRRARAAHRDARARTSSVRSRSSTRCSTGAGSAPTWARASRCTTRMACVAAARAACRATATSRRRGALRVMPSLRKDALVGALQYYDGQVDDARHTMIIARTAAAYGAQRRQPRPGHRASCARASGWSARWCATWSPAASSTSGPSRWINATGVWTDDTQALAGERGQFHVRASKGVHLVVPRDRIHSDSGLILRTEKCVLFVIPWGRHWIIGTTDTDWDAGQGPPGREPRRHRLPARARQRACCSSRSPTRTSRASTPGCGRCCPASRSRPPSCPASTPWRSPVPGLVVVAGGKYTTYRVMARDAVDAAVHGARRKVPPSFTERIPLLGAEGYAARGTRATCSPPRTGLHVARIEHLLGRYGSLIDELLDLVAADPTLGEPLAGAAGLPAGRGRATPRRTRARGTWTTCWPAAPASRSRRRDRGSGGQEVAALVAPVLGWDASTTSRARSSTTGRGSRPSGSPRPARRPHRRRGPARRTGRTGGRQRPGLTRPSDPTVRRDRPAACRGAPWLALMPGGLAG